MDNLDIDAIRARCDAAIPGPWKVEINRSISNDKQDICKPCKWFQDAIFIAHARTDIPKLLDEVERLQKQVDGFLQDKQEYDAENAALKKALEMMYADNKGYNPDGMGNPKWYIQHAKEDLKG